MIERIVEQDTLIASTIKLDNQTSKYPCIFVDNGSNRGKIETKLIQMTVNHNRLMDEYTDRIMKKEEQIRLLVDTHDIEVNRIHAIHVKNLKQPSPGDNKRTFDLYGSEIDRLRLEVTNQREKYNSLQKGRTHLLAERKQMKVTLQQYHDSLSDVQSQYNDLISKTENLIPDGSQLFRRNGELTVAAVGRYIETLIEQNRVCDAEYRAVQMECIQLLERNASMLHRISEGHAQFNAMQQHIEQITAVPIDGQVPRSEYNREKFRFLTEQMALHEELSRVLIQTTSDRTALEIRCVELTQRLIGVSAELNVARLKLGEPQTKLTPDTTVHTARVPSGCSIRGLLVSTPFTLSASIQ